MVSYDGQWKAVDKNGEHEEFFDPNHMDDREPSLSQEYHQPGWMIMAMGAQYEFFCRATWSADGWQFKQRLRQRYRW